MNDWQPGNSLENGKYTLLKELGRGGFGITYLAHNKDNQQVVIKTLNTSTIPPNYFDKFRKDFYNEAVRLAKCSHHPHIVEIIELIEEQGLPCIVMEYVSGRNLFDRVHEQGIVSEAIALLYIEQIASALQVVHQQKILHRDIKPHNILIRENGKDAVLIDFGIAREYDPKKAGSYLTSFESQGYTPFEQLYVDPKRPPSYYTDVYGLAATFYFILTGQTPTDTRNRALSVANQQQDPLLSPQSLNPNISGKVNEAILKGMEIYPEKRPQTLYDWIMLLREKSLEASSSATIVELPLIAPNTLISQSTGPMTEIVSQPPVVKKKLGTGLIIAGILAISVSIAGYLIYSKNTHSNYSLSKYSGQGLNIQYPSTWLLSSYEPSPLNPTFAEVVAPQQNNGTSASKVIFEVINLNENKSLEQVAEQTINEVKANVPKANIIENQKITVGQTEAYQLIYSSEEDRQDLKSKQVLILDNKQLYIITYQAGIDQYAQDEKLADQIMTTVQLLP